MKKLFAVFSLFFSFNARAATIAQRDTKQAPIQNQNQSQNQKPRPADSKMRNLGRSALNANVLVLTEFPLVLGLGTGLDFQFNEVLGLVSFQLGYLPETYANSILQGVSAADSSFTPQMSELIVTSLQSTQVYQGALGGGYKLMTRLCLYGSFGMSFIKLEGESSGASIFSAAFPQYSALSPLLADVNAKIAADILIFDLRLGVNYGVWKDLQSFAGVGYSFVQNSSTSVTLGTGSEIFLLRAALDSLELEAEKKVDSSLEKFGKIPVLFIGLKYSFGLL